MVRANKRGLEIIQMDSNEQSYLEVDMFSVIKNKGGPGNHLNFRNLFESENFHCYCFTSNKKNLNIEDLPVLPILPK